MPIVRYGCENGHSLGKFYRSGKDATPTIVCDKCGLEMKRILSAPSNQSKIVVDNGVQARAVEINLEVIEANKERANKDYREEP